MSEPFDRLPMFPRAVELPMFPLGRLLPAFPCTSSRTVTAPWPATAWRATAASESS